MISSIFDSWSPATAHALLIGTSILGALISVAGIVWENADKSSLRHRLATRLVLGGVALECACSVLLFAYDERLSGLQSDKIIALEQSVGTAKAAASTAKADAGTAKTNADAATAAAQSAQQDLGALGQAESALRTNLATDESHVRKINVWQTAVIESLKPRDISQKQVDKIRSALKANLGKIFVYSLCDPEAASYAWTVEKTLTLVGYSVQWVLAAPLNSGKAICFDKFEVQGVSSTGLSLRGTKAEQPALTALMGALANAQVDIASDFTAVDDEALPHPSIFVGLKSPPFQTFPGWESIPDLKKFMKKHPPKWMP